MENYYVTKELREKLEKVCDEEEMEMVDAMDMISGDEFWVWYGSPPEVVLEMLTRRFKEI